MSLTLEEYIEKSDLKIEVHMLRMALLTSKSNLERQLIRCSDYLTEFDIKDINDTLKEVIEALEKTEKY